MTDFAHLHVHSEYSVLDGTNKIKALCERVKELGMSSVAVTDHGVLHGVVEFYKKAKDVGVKPIIGVEAYVTYDDDGKEKKEMTRDNYHMILLAKNNTGLQNLYKLISTANQHNFYYKPRISWKNLAQNSEGLIATSACLGGWVAKHGDYGDGTTWTPGAEQVCERAVGLALQVFGSDFYLEIQDNGLPQQEQFNAWAINEAKKGGVKLIMSCDAHYLKSTDFTTHQLIMAQQFKQTLEQYQAGCDEALVYSDKLYIRDGQELLDIATHWGVPEAAENTLRIAEACNVELTLGKYKSPLFNVEQEEDYQDFLNWREHAKKEEVGLG
jgi:DNA polymerase-3 subunit alpha